MKKLLFTLALTFLSVGFGKAQDKFRADYNYICFYDSDTDSNIDTIMKSKTIDGYEEEHNVLFLIPNTNNKVWIKITDWSPTDSNIPDPNSVRRGRITEDFKVAPFFEHVKMNEFGY